MIRIPRKTTPSGELIFHVFSALAQFEGRLIQERTKSGLAEARARGRKGGRPVLSPDHPRIVLAAKLFLDKSISVDAICATLKISKTTLCRYVAFARRASQTSQETPE
jgi:DNA invertase Pin-like site-specific DNA recombinase